MSADIKTSLIQAYYKAEHNLSALRAEVLQTERDIADLSGKIKLASDTHDLANEAKMHQEELQNKMDMLERLAAKCETLAARENSRRNSSNEVQEMNQNIERALQKVHNIEAQLSQMSMDVAALEHDKKKLEQDFEEQNNDFTEKLTTVYSTIQQYREDISQTRFKNLTSFIAKQDKFAKSEIELQQIQTMVLAYSQLVLQTQAELAALQDPDNGMTLLNAEVEKIEYAIQAIPQHMMIPEEQQNQSRLYCEKLVNEVKELEQKIISSISEMAQAENNQDSLAKQLHDESTGNEKVKTMIQQAENKMNETEAQIKTLQEEDANKLDNAKKEIERLIELTQNLEKQNREKESQILVFKDGTSAIPNEIRKVKSPIDALINKIQNDSRELSNEINLLQNEERRLKMESTQVLLLQ